VDDAVPDRVDELATLPDAVQEASGGFDTQVSFLHQCETGCEGDTIVTGYVAELTDAQNRIGASTDGGIPFFQPGGETYSFPSSQLAWVDVDPFDGDPDRNDDRSDRPSHHQPDEDPDERHHQQT
jgi:hypothetical protein